MELAVWGHPTREFPEGKDNVADMETWLGKLRDAGVSIYIPFVTSGGKPIFASKQLGEPERDLLGPIVETAHRLGIEVHPTVGLGGVTPGFSDTAGFYVPLAGPGEDLPSWSARWVDPAWEENVAAVCALSRQLLDDYDCDGLHMDAVRYANSMVLDEHPCVCERCRAARKEWLGTEVPDEQDMARPGVVALEIKMREDFVRGLAEELRDICDERELPLSLAGRARYLKDAVPEGQNWAQWCADGLLDFVCPMSYNPCLDRFQRFVEQHTRILEGTDTPLYAGVGRKSSLGVLSPQDMIRQLEYLDEVGVEGACIFSSLALEDEDLHLLAEFMEQAG